MLFVGSAIAVVAAWCFIAAGVSADAISQTMVWLSVPWFLALYFLSYRPRKLAEGSIEVVLNFGIVATYAAPLFVAIVVFAQFVKAWH